LSQLDFHLKIHGHITSYTNHETTGFYDHQPFRYFSLLYLAVSFAIVFALTVTIWCLVSASTSFSILAHLQTLRPELRKYMHATGPHFKNPMLTIWKHPLISATISHI